MFNRAKKTKDEASLLWKEVRKGKKEAFETIYFESFDFLFNYGMRICNSRPIVEDAIQTVFLDVWNKRKQITIKTSIRAYLFTCLRRNLILDIDKTQKTRLENATEYTNLNLIEIQNDERDKTEIIKRIYNQAEQLPKRQKEIIYLKYKENLSYDEIEAIMGISRASLYKLLHKAVAQLKKSMK